jgi:hypothetical protein
MALAIHDRHVRPKNMGFPDTHESRSTQKAYPRDCMKGSEHPYAAICPFLFLLTQLDFRDRELHS